jgi:hypothetical protein
MRNGWIAAVVLAMAGLAWGYPTFTGATGSAQLPTADVVGDGEVQAALDFHALGDSVNGDAWPLRAVGGLGSRVEAHAAYVVQQDNNAWAVGAKYLTPLTPGGFDWSLGAQRIKATDIDTQIDQIYFVGTRTIDTGNPDVALRSSLGVNWTETTNDPLAFHDRAVRVFAGNRLTFGNGLSLNTEIQSKASSIEDEPMSSIFFRYPASDTVDVQAGFSNGQLGVAGLDEHKFFLGAALRL